MDLENFPTIKEEVSERGDGVTIFKGRALSEPCMHYEVTAVITIKKREYFIFKEL